MSEYTNRGVNCTIESCRYHCGQDCCNAPVIAVRSCNSSGTSSRNSVKNSAETSCATFESVR
ncbi:MAG: DUF1540 domain-containing protein [Clostridia bacterium]|nr:DUF1540 domain-containing protein [Clostridia bacterium]